MSSGGGGQGSTTQTVNQNNIPDWAQPYALGMLNQASNLTSINKNPYQQYQGTQVAGFNPMQNQAFQNIGGMQTAPQLNQAFGATGMATTNALSPQQYANQVGKYMSPYTQTLQNQAIGNYANTLPQLGSAATAAGGLGGSREALMQSQAQQGLQSQLAGIQQQAYQNAQGEYNTQNQMALQGAGQLGQLAQEQYGQQMGINQAQLGAGQQIQNLAQNVDTTNYQNFLNQQNYPYKELGFMSDILHGVPTSNSASQFYGPQPNQYSQLYGLAGQIMSGGSSGSGTPPK